MFNKSTTREVEDVKTVYSLFKYVLYGLSLIKPLTTDLVISACLRR